MAFPVKYVTLVNYFMIAAFILSVIVQYNDPDYGWWMTMYGAAALASILWKWIGPSQLLYLLVGTVALCWMLYLLITYGDQLSLEGVFDSVSMKSQSIEIFREIGGLFIVSAWMTVLYFHSQEK